MQLKAVWPLVGLATLIGASLINLAAKHPEKQNRWHPHAEQYRYSPQTYFDASIRAEHNKDEEKQENGWQSYFDKPTDWLLTIFTGFLAIYTRRLYQATAGLFVETKRLSDAADSQKEDTAKSIREATRAAAAMEKSADSIGRTADTNEKMFETQRDFWGKQTKAYGHIVRFGKVLSWVALGGAGVSLFILYFINQQLGEMKSSRMQADQIIASYKRLADSAEDSQRAWIGPLTVIANAPVAGQGFKATASYANSGREAAAIDAGIKPDIFTKDEWNNGTAAQKIRQFEAQCISIQVVTNGRVAFPSTGFGNAYNSYLDTNSDGADEKSRYVADQRLIDGDTVVVVDGCFVYRTGKKSGIRRSASSIRRKPPISRTSIYALQGITLTKNVMTHKGSSA